MLFRDSLPLPTSRTKAMALTTGLVLLLLAHSMALIFRVQPGVSLWFPPAGVAIALTFWFGPIGALLTGIASMTMAPFWGSTGWTRLLWIIDGIEPLIAWFLYFQVFQGTLRLKNINSVIAFLICAPFAGSCSLAIVGSLTLMASGRLPSSLLEQTISSWWLGNAIGILVIAPPTLIFLTPLLRKWGLLPSTKLDSPIDSQTSQLAVKALRRNWLEVSLILLISVFSGFATVFATRSDVTSTLQLSLLSLIPILWAAIRFGVRGGVLTASFSVLITLIAYLLIYPNAINLAQFPINASLLHTHKLSLLVQCVIGLLVGIAISDRVSSEVALAIEQVRLAEYEARAVLSEQLFQLNRQLTHANQQLQLSESRFRTSVENMLDCFGIYSAIRNEAGEITDFRTEYLNQAACINNQMSLEEQLGHGLCELLPGHLESELFDAYCRVVETGEPLVKDDLIYQDTYGQQTLARAFDIRVARYGDGFVATWRDVTARRQAEAALIEQRHFSQQITDTIPESDIHLRPGEGMQYLRERSGNSTFGLFTRNRSGNGK